jgi:hypothetical protein
MGGVIRFERAIASRMRPVMAQLAGLSAHKAAAERRLREGEGFAITRTFEEHETGKGADAIDRRPQLAAAIKAARKPCGPSRQFQRLTISVAIGAERT